MTDDERTEDAEQTEEVEDEPADEAVDESADEPGDEEPVAEEEMPLPEVDVFDILRMSLGMLIQEAWIAMGVQAREGAGETTVNLHAARVAIDVIEVMGEKLAGEGGPDEQQAINQILTDLRVNFVRVSSKGEEQS